MDHHQMNKTMHAKNWAMAFSVNAIFFFIIYTIYNFCPHW